MCLKTIRNNTTAAPEPSSLETAEWNRITGISQVRSTGQYRCGGVLSPFESFIG